MKKIITSAVGKMIYIVWVMAALTACRNLNQITVGLTNNSAVPLQELVIQFTGGSVPLGPLAVGERKEVKIKPSGESQLEINFTPEGKSIEHRVIGTYLEPGYRGRIEIKLNKDLTVESSENVSVY